VKLLADLTLGGGISILTRTVRNGEERIALRSLLQYDGDHLLWADPHLADDEALRRRHFRELQQAVRSMQMARRYLDRVTGLLILSIALPAFGAMNETGTVQAFILELAPGLKDLHAVTWTAIAVAIPFAASTLLAMLLSYALRPLASHYLPWFIKRIRPHLATKREASRISINGNGARTGD
jgi:hypothetical protein